MLPDRYLWILREFEPEGDPWQLQEIAAALEADGNLEGAATVYDRAFGLAPFAEEIVTARQRVLDCLAVRELGLTFRYVPGGVFLMGSDDGPIDERPRHPVWLSPYWMTTTPISWADYCRLMDWSPPPQGMPRVPDEPPGTFSRSFFNLREMTKIRLQYCEDQTTHAVDWHGHFQQEANAARSPFQGPPRLDPAAPWAYERKPIVAVSWQDVEVLAQRHSSPAIIYGLPTEAQWEKAARGGRIGARHAWGDEPPTTQRCDFGRFDQFSIMPSDTFPPNGYGLYAINGGVWEWTRDWYDRDYYRESSHDDPTGPSTGHEKVLRGGSWSDCAEVCTVTFRMSRAASAWTDENWQASPTPNIGFRLCRMVSAVGGKK
jgi:formylglycine-generating enzyme required for sulfatase activity